MSEGGPAARSSQVQGECEGESEGEGCKGPQSTFRAVHTPATYSSVWWDEIVRIVARILVVEMWSCDVLIDYLYYFLCITRQPPLLRID